MISGGLNSKVYLVRLSGFDTHNNQVQDAGSPLGEHHELLSTLSEAVKAFLDDLNAQGLADDVVGATYSEFGRKIAENGNLGTDHGQVSPMFVFGKPVEAGVTGINPDLTEASNDNNYQIETLQYDYREAFATIFQDFMAANNDTVNSAFYNHTTISSFAGAKINGLLKEAYLVPEDCYTAISNVSSIEDTSFEVYPNPFKSAIQISSNRSLSDFIRYEVYGLGGQLLSSGSIRIANSNSISIQLGNLSAGIYILHILSDRSTHSFKIVKS